MIRYRGHRHNLALMSLAFKINNELTPEQCFDYIMTKRYSDYSTRFKLKDTISNLKQMDSMIKFIIANERPLYYKIHPTKYKQEVDSLKKVILLK